MMPSLKSSNDWTLSELFGQKRLLGLGAVMIWLVLFHLLVNVWLLCIFTSFLVVLGGWFGSRAVLNANSLLHLEHFLPIGAINPPPFLPEHEWRLNHEIHSAVHKAVRDFVSSWYRTLLPEVEGEFECAVRNTMLDSVMELKARARCVDRKALVQHLLELYGSHLQSYMTARQVQSSQREAISLWQIYSEVDAPHPAMISEAAELSYSRALVNLVLHVLVPYPQMETRTGGYMVTELITCNVLLPLIRRVSDPDWLNKTIVDIFTKSKEPQEMDEIPTAKLYRCQVQQESWTTCMSPSSSEQVGLTTKSLSDLDDQQRQSTICDSSLQCGPVGLTCMESCHAGVLTPGKMHCCSLTSGQLSDSKKISLDSLIQSDSEDDLTAGFCDCGHPKNLCHMSKLNEVEALCCSSPLKNLGLKVFISEDSQWPAGMAQEKSPSCSPGRVCQNSYNLYTPNIQASPVHIQNVHISGSVTAKEQRGSGTYPYTLYTVKFETVSEAEYCTTLEPAACHSVSRRYNEFLNLQTRLEEKHEFKKLIKNIKGPKKYFPELPFGHADSERVEARKSQLDMYLKQLSRIPEIANSEDMQDFLAVKKDVCTYFGRKPFTKSRIDKIMENALDTLKTAFPYAEPLSPTEDLEGDADGNRKYRRLVFPSKIPPSLNILDLHPKVTYCFSEGSTVLNGMTLSGLETFIGEQEKRLSCQKENKTTKQSEQSDKDKPLGKTHGADTAVADVALKIVCVLMKDQWSWLCTENIQKTIRLLFGTFIERWLDVGVAHLTSAPCWVIYLQVLQEAVWPGGKLPAQPQPERSAAERAETKWKCLECLMQLLPDLITDMLGNEYRWSLETMLESLQDHHINKHLIYCICDLLLEFLIPESCDKGFQMCLLQSLTKDTEKENPHS
ncbi:sorting nexin-19a isoform X2 [Solea solea]|uniref:sorting nexin-19a isoform X2 n=1 Tax=Solea solea TaxID=90069 RepID=UPI00272A1874|nr:sorting nexin-19a isoform X2 [Solea solea]